MAVPNFRVGLAGAPHPNNVARDLQARACNLANGDLYLFPNRSSPAIDATKPITFTWATDCAMSSQVDIYLYAQGSTYGVAHGWRGVPYSTGSYTTQLQPNYWNSTTTALLQISIVNSGSPAFNVVPGPIFTVNYPASAMYSTTSSGGQIVTSTNPVAASQSANAVFENVNSTQGNHISKGGIAAAVIVPILVLGALVGVAVWFWRQREAEKRKKWSRAMSSHSNLEWEKGAAPGEKPHSILGRPSIGSYHQGNMRTASIAGSSVYATENLAGAGAGMVRPPLAHFSHSADNIHQQRASLMLPEGNMRQSRISFAETARPTRDARASIGGDIRPSSVFKLPLGSRSATELNTPNKPKQAAYATGSAIDDEEDDINISPSQLQGPNAFADAEMRRVGGNKSRTGRKSLLSLGGSRRESVVSHLSADDFRSAASARGSTDELRDLEASIMARRSVLSQYSGTKSTPDLHGSPVAGQWSNPNSPYLPQHDSNAAETLSHDEPVSYPAPSPLPSTGSTSTVAYGPDQMLAVYAARAKGNAPVAPAPAVAPAPKKQGIRILTGLGKRNNDDAPASASEMRSYVHLNQGTASSAAVEALPLPGPAYARNRSNTTSRGGPDDDDVGQAK